ncbi:3-dehydroquinate synthase [Sulfurimonas sp. HSL-1716]|uniref:3-dehydroquinate synthase n=1 Tax=Hydrocurvibacter sulfurireducens TaxID=3131937 RepID=UPI0031F83941
MVVDIALKKVVDDSYKITIDKLKDIHFDTKTAIITNPTVAGFHLRYLLNAISAKELYVITVPDGEEYKNQETIDMILENLFNHRFNRNSLLIAFGGGVIGDMTGYAASIYQRGIDFIQIPTTLLSQVDASVGGKTGMNNTYGKNLVGAFHQPNAVYIDPYFLSTLPSREFAAGIAEIVKMAVTFDDEFFSWLEENDLNNTTLLAEAVKKSVEIKADVVSKDEKEKGLRAALNYGHTFAHVIENETEYKTYLHGEAVSIGMVMANALALKLELLTEHEAMRIKNILLKYRLPVSYDVKDIESFYEAFYLDKKSSDTMITFILPEHIGGVKITDEVDSAVVKDVLRSFKAL